MSYFLRLHFYLYEISMYYTSTVELQWLYYLETIVAIGLKVGLNIQINELMKLNEYQRSRSLFDLGQRSLRFHN